MNKILTAIVSVYLVLSATYVGYAINESTSKPYEYKDCYIEDGEWIFTIIKDYNTLDMYIVGLVDDDGYIMNVQVETYSRLKQPNVAPYNCKHTTYEIDDAMSWRLNKLLEINDERVE